MFTLKLYRENTLHIRQYDTININTDQEFLSDYQGDIKPYAFIFARSGEHAKDWPIFPGDRAYIVNGEGKTVESVTGVVEI